MKLRALVALLILAGCGGAPKPPLPPPELSLDIQAGPDQNPDTDGKANPVAVRILMLNGPSRFMAASYFTLLDKERETIGEELAASETVLVAPGESVHLARPVRDGVQVLGVSVGFRDIDHATWRASAPIKPHGPTHLVLSTRGIVARLSAVEGKAP